MSDIREKAEKIIDYLNGTCMSLQEALEKYNAEGLENNSEFCAILDEKLFECERCNWWHEQSEMPERNDDRWICADCTFDT